MYPFTFVYGTFHICPDIGTFKYNFVLNINDLREGQHYLKVRKINKSKSNLSTKIAAVTMSVIMLSIIPIAFAGIPPFFPDPYAWPLPMYNNIIMSSYAEGLPPMWLNPYAPVDNYDSSENIYFGIEAYRGIDEAEDGSFPIGPYNVKLWIDGEQVSVQRFAYSNEAADPKKSSVFYHIFGPDYFTPGQQCVVYYEFWVFKPCFIDPAVGWRIWASYEYTIYFY
jgi:hypothetical protein